MAEKLPPGVTRDALRKRRRLILKVLEHFDAHGPEVMPFVGLDEFFDGNYDEWSFAPNIYQYGRPPLAECWNILRSIGERPEVQDVLIGIHDDFPSDPDDPSDFDTWPKTDWVCVLSSAPEEDIVSWSRPLLPNAVGEEDWRGQRPPSLPPLGPGMKDYTLWWD